MADSRPDTICALATSPGPGSLAVVRVSGPDTVQLLGRVTRLYRARRPRSHTARLLWLFDERGRRVDHVMVTYFRGPRSYTGEDMAEITCHGGGATSDRILRLLVGAGGRMARPGEFSWRACLNRKMSLSQAEAVNDLIHARTEVARERALARYRAGRSDFVARLRVRLVEELAGLELGLGIDDLPTPRWPDSAGGVRDLADELGRAVQSAERERLLFRGARVVVTGRPNVGKSSLFNRLVGHDRAIVDSRPGTTRDVVSFETEIRGVPVCLLDSAGVPCPANSRLGRAAAERTEAAVAAADLVIAVFDRSAPAAGADRLVLAAVAGRPVLPVLNKSDLVARLDHRSLLGSSTRPAVVSCHTGRGLSGLRVRLGRRLGPLPGRALTVGGRQLTVLRACHDALRRSLAAQEVEAAALEIRAAVDMLSQVDAPTSSSEILARVFADFCVGK